MFSGVLKNMKEPDLRRLIIKMLMMGFLEESFVSMKVQGNTNVSVYITLGRHIKRFEGRCQIRRKASYKVNKWMETKRFTSMRAKLM